MSADFDLHNSIFMEVNIPLEQRGVSTASGTAVDTNRFNGIEFLVSGAGLDGAGTVTFTMQETDDPTFVINNEVDSTFIIGNLSDLDLTTLIPVNQIKRIGYVGKKRFVRLTFVSTVGGIWGAFAIKFAKISIPTETN